MRGIVGYADYLVIASADSHPQMEALCRHVEERLAPAPPLHREGGSSNPWRLLDYGAVVVHLFHREARGFYALDRLYGDARKVRFAGAKARRA